MKSPIPVPEKTMRPEHVAIIMDGNGRWATQRGLSRLAGHKKGADVVREITTFARELEIPYLTLFSFSVQNWCRPLEEVHGLMQLLEEYCIREVDELVKNGIRLVSIGDLSRLPPRTRGALEKLMEHTAHNKDMTLTLAVNYGGREELVRAMRKVASMMQAQGLQPEDIDEAMIESSLDTGSTPPPDLLIRTSGERRISNFLLWQLAYTEIHFTNLRWPELDRKAFADALWDYAGRERRFGGLGVGPNAVASVNGHAGRELGGIHATLEEDSTSC